MRTSQPASENARGRRDSAVHGFVRRATVVAGVLWCCAAGCAARPLRLHLSAAVRLPDRYVHVFFADGLRKAALEQLLERGELPNIQQRFVDGGVCWKNTVVCLPSVTYANTVSLLTGVHPGAHGILNNDWFVEGDAASSTQPAARNYSSAATYTRVNDDFSQPTLHELLQNEPTANILCPTFRGADFNFLEPVITGVRWFFEDYEGVNRNSAETIEELAAAARQQQRWPAFTVQYFPGVDETAHWYGSASERYLNVLRQLDADLGRVLDSVAHSPLADRTMFVLVTDHSHVPAPPGRRIDLVEEIRQRSGLAILESPTATGRSLKQVLRKRAVVVSVASRVAMWHVLHGHGESGGRAMHRARLLAALQQSASIDLICTRLPDGIEVSRRDARALVKRVDDGYLYQPVNGDPLDYASGARVAELIARGAASADEWLSATYDHRYPDFPPQIVEMFNSPAAGDVVTFAADDWTFKPDHASGHGAPLRDDCVVSYFFAGNGLPAGVTMPFARNLDLAPTILHLLGRIDVTRRSDRGLSGCVRLPP